ncbi:MAG: hypothetical protein R3D69_13960 [Xanthobacteraceae bacterium]
MARDLPGTAATIAKRLAERNISLESIVQRHPNGAPGTPHRAWKTWAEGRVRAGAGDIDNLCHDRGRRPPGPCRGAEGQSDYRTAAGHPDEKN